MMRLEADLRPADRAVPAPDPAHWPALAERLGARLREIGFEVDWDPRDGPQHSCLIVTPSTEQDLCFIMQVPGDHGWLFAEGWDVEPQPSWSYALRVLEAVRAVCGWEADSRAEFNAEAALLSVADDGTIMRPAELTADELEQAVTELLDAVPAEHTLDRILDSRATQALDAAARRIAARLPIDAPPMETLIEVMEHSTHASLDSPGAPTEQVRLLVRIAAKEALLLREQLGDERTGRIVALKVHYRPAAGCTLTPIFDRLPRHDGPFPYHWEGHARDILRRDPAWQPAWLPAVTALLCRGGWNI